MRITEAAFAGLLLVSLALGQDHKNNAGSMPNLPAMPGMNVVGVAPAMHAMQSRHMNMDPHMKLTSLREPQPGDAH